MFNLLNVSSLLASEGDHRLWNSTPHRDRDRDRDPLRDRGQNQITGLLPSKLGFFLNHNAELTT